MLLSMIYFIIILWLTGMEFGLHLGKHHLTNSVIWRFFKNCTVILVLKFLHNFLRTYFIIYSIYSFHLVIFYFCTISYFDLLTVWNWTFEDKLFWNNISIKRVLRHTAFIYRHVSMNVTYKILYELGTSKTTCFHVVFICETFVPSI